MTPLPPTPFAMTTVRTLDATGMLPRLPELETYLLRRGDVPLSLHPAWLQVLARGLGHTPYCLEAHQGGSLRGFLPLSYVRSWVFGKFLVSLPYLNYGGPVADDNVCACMLVDRAAELADKLGVRFLELRHTEALDHPMLTERMTTKVHMKLPLPTSTDTLWKQLDAKVRNQIRKGQKSGLDVAWGGADLLDEFYDVFSRNMRDLGTPVYGKQLFAAILETFPDRAEFCVARQGHKPVAAALLLHGWGVTEVPSASSLRQYNHLNANMLVYWHLLERAVGRGQAIFDFGRSSEGSNTYRFKRQWGSRPCPAVWHYYRRAGSVQAVRTENPRYQRMIRVWRRLPLSLTRLLGPVIVRGIP